MKPVIVELLPEKIVFFFLQNGDGRAVIRKILRSDIFTVFNLTAIPFYLEQKTKMFYFLHA